MSDLWRTLGRPGPKPQRNRELTGREHEVIKLFAEGESNKTVGVILNVSEHVIKFHKQNIFAKLGAVNTAHAVALYTRWELTHDRSDSVQPDLNGPVVSGESGVGDALALVEIPEAPQ